VIGACCVVTLFFWVTSSACSRTHAVDLPLPGGCGRRCMVGSWPGAAGTRPGGTPAMSQPVGRSAVLRQSTAAAMRAAQGADPPSPELTAIANTPQAYWIVPGSSRPRSRSTPVTRRLPAPCRCGTLWNPHATAATSRPVVRDGRGLPRVDRRCRSQPGSSPAAVIVEPDALAMADCLSGDQRQERFDLIRYAVDTLSSNPATAVYIDAGPLALAQCDEMAARLNQAV